MAGIVPFIMLVALLFPLLERVLNLSLAVKERFQSFGDDFPFIFAVRRALADSVGNCR